MKALAIDEFNTDPTQRELPAPSAGEGEIVVDVSHSSVNGMDLFTLNGMVQHMMPFEFPITLGRDYAGTVAAVGRGVTEFAVGDPVFGMILPVPLHDGTFAEQVKVPVSCASRRPDGLDAADAGALGLAGGAARRAVDALALSGGETVLIVGATGGVGSYAVQMAKTLGATVVATAAPGQEDFVRGLGADETVDHTGDLAAAVRTRHPKGVECAIHLVGDGSSLADLLVPGGRLSSTLGLGPDAVAGRDVQATPVMTIPSPELLSGLGAAVVLEELRVARTTDYPLAQAGQALKDFGAGALGKLGVTI
jgi:NADPH:quinone reductase-like Zn-dependent oxidoreductase